MVVIESAGVTLKDLNIEVTGSEDKLGEDQKCALIARSAGAVRSEDATAEEAAARQGTGRA